MCYDAEAAGDVLRGDEVCVGVRDRVHRSSWLCYSSCQCFCTFCKPA